MSYDTNLQTLRILSRDVRPVCATLANINYDTTVGINTRRARVRDPLWTEHARFRLVMSLGTIIEVTKGAFDPKTCVPTAGQICRLLDLPFLGDRLLRFHGGAAKLSIAVYAY